MKSKYLLPHFFKKIGWAIAIPFLVLGIYYINFQGTFAALNGPDWLKSSLGFSLEDITGVALISGLLLVSFSREKTEDEYINKIRLESFQIAILINYVLLVACIILFYGLDFLDVLVYNMFTILLIFIIRFNYLIFRNKHAA